MNKEESSKVCVNNKVLEIIVRDTTVKKSCCLDCNKSCCNLFCCCISTWSFLLNSLECCCFGCSETCICFSNTALICKGCLEGMDCDGH
jgi:hypothetical protein